MKDAAAALLYGFIILISMIASFLFYGAILGVIAAGGYWVFRLLT